MNAIRRIMPWSLTGTPLLFPGKVLADAQNGRLFIADTNHNRIVITNLNGVVQAVVGSGLAEMADGNFLQAARPIYRKQVAFSTPFPTLPD